MYLLFIYCSIGLKKWINLNIGNYRSFSVRYDITIPKCHALVPTQGDCYSNNNEESLILTRIFTNKFQKRNI